MSTVQSRHQGARGRDHRPREHGGHSTGPRYAGWSNEWLGVCLATESGVDHVVVRCTKVASPMRQPVGPVKDADNVADGYAVFKYFSDVAFFACSRSSPRLRS